ncbi:sensor histidine kinase [Roseobacter sp. A03A-229]
MNFEEYVIEILQDVGGIILAQQDGDIVTRFPNSTTKFGESTWIVRTFDSIDDGEGDLEKFLSRSFSELSKTYKANLGETPLILAPVIRGPLDPQVLSFRIKPKLPYQILDEEKFRSLSERSDKLWKENFGKEALQKGELEIQLREVKTEVSDLRHQILKYDSELKEERKRSQRLEANSLWKIMASFMIHDLTNAMLPLNGRINAAKNCIVTDPERLPEILEKLDSLSSDISERLEKFKIKKVALNQTRIAVNDLMSELRDWCSIHDVKFNGQRKKAYIEIDKLIFFDVLQELKYNTEKYAKESADRNLHARVIERADRSRIFQLDYSDDGPGVPEALKEKIFLPGYSSASQKAEDKKKGKIYENGEGLAFVSDVVSRMNGSVKEVGKFQSGATFRFIFPLHNAEVTP